MRLGKKDVIQALRKANLKGRGGAEFPTWIKWSNVKNQKEKIKYVICNGAEGEPGVKKDFFILKNYPHHLIRGIRIAMKFLDAKEGIIYLRKDYYREFKKKLNELIGKNKIVLFKKPKNSGYVGGIDTTLINVIEGKRTEPRLIPPFPTEKGLFNSPTLVNNIETFYQVSLIFSKKREKNKLYTITGKCKNKGVYELSENLTINDILKQTDNYPPFEFFIRTGGDFGGETLNQSSLNIPTKGVNSITIYKLNNHNPKRTLKKLVSFFKEESCGQCTICREGTYRLKEILKSKNPDWKVFIEILNCLRETSFCGLGKTVPFSVESYLKNVFIHLPEKQMKSIKNYNQLIKIIKK